MREKAAGAPVEREARQQQERERGRERRAGAPEERETRRQREQI